MKTHLLSPLLISALLLTAEVKAQRMFGVATSNWSGTSSLYLNPASIADPRQKFVFNIIGFNTFVENDLGTINNNKLFSQVNSNELLKVNDVFKFDNRATVNLMLPYAEVNGPGFMWNINHRNSIAVTTRLRGANQFTNVNEKIYRTVLDPTYSTSGHGDYNVRSRDFKWNAATWGELGFTYGRVLIDRNESFLSMGVSVRYLAAAAYVTMTGNVNAQYYAANDSLRLTNSRVTLSSNVTESYRRQETTESPSMFSRFFGNKGGSGVGGDIGFSYEFRPRYEDYLYEEVNGHRIIDRGSPKYKLRVSAAVTDIGAMTFNNRVSREAVASGNGYIIGSTVGDNVNGYRNFTSYARQQGFRVDTFKKTTTYYLPTALVASIDYKVYKNFFVNATSITNIAEHTRTGNYFYNQVTVTPRFDKSIFSLGVPLTYNMFSQSFKAGLGARIGGFYIGGDDLLGLIGNNQYGVNLYAGLHVPINYEKPHDRDGDHITDRRDNCPDTPGIWAFKGCPDPDRDKDGVLNNVDWCPDTAGSATAHGCPDRDRDGVTDATDRCPDVPGLREMGGCPDRDKDGITDADDVCPDMPGLAAFRGCPDTDKDGLADNNDKCPTEPGPISLQGCPDKDGDGVADNIDRCPNMRGLASNYGCPEVKVEVIKRLSHAATALEFETGKTIIKVTSYGMLDEIVDLLNEYSDYYMDIEGHTDNVGSDESNQILSEGRANAVKEYFVAKGVASDRLVTRGMGESMPVATNATEAGKAQNRRVKMTLKLREK